MKEEKTTEQPEETVKKPENEPTRTVEAASPRQPRRPVVAIVVVVVLLCLAAGVAGAKLYDVFVKNNATVGHEPLANDGNKTLTKEEADIASVVKKVSPSVVSVVTKSVSNKSFFGPEEEQGAGTGIIVSKDGYILTNKHVVNGASTVSVVLSDGTRYSDVKVLGTDPLNDVAFLKVPDANNLTPAELGDSTSIQVGQKVVAIGNSLGQYQNTVTNGIISGTGRPVAAQSGESVENLTDLIQTDAAINPGNSGGPLLNLAGQVIGINTAIIEDAQGIGFAIPIGSTKGILKSVLRGDGVQRAFLGINYLPVTADVAHKYDLSVKKGAYVFSGEGGAVVNGSPADRAGVKEKDVITKVGGVAVGDKGGLATLVGEYAPGDKVELVLLRDGKEKTVTVTLEAYKH